MKLSEIKNITVVESKMAERHADLQDAIMDEFDLEDTSPMVDKIVAYLVDNTDDAKVDDFLADHFEDSLNRGGDFDPKDWIANKMAQIFKGKY